MRDYAMEGEGATDFYTMSLMAQTAERQGYDNDLKTTERDFRRERKASSVRRRARTEKPGIARKRRDGGIFVRRAGEGAHAKMQGVRLSVVFRRLRDSAARGAFSRRENRDFRKDEPSRNLRRLRLLHRSRRAERGFGRAFAKARRAARRDFGKIHFAEHRRTNLQRACAVFAVLIRM